MILGHYPVRYRTSHEEKQPSPWKPSCSPIPRAFPPIFPADQTTPKTLGPPSPPTPATVSDPSGAIAESEAAGGAMDNALASAAAIADQRQKIEQYRHILSSVLSFSPPDISQAKRFLDHSNEPSIFAPLPVDSYGFCSGSGVTVGFGAAAVVSDEVPLVVSRQLLQTFAQELGRLEPEAQKEVAHYALTQIQPRVVSFEEQVGTFVYTLGFKSSMLAI